MAKMANIMLYVFYHKSKGFETLFVWWENNSVIPGEKMLVNESQSNVEIGEILNGKYFHEILLHYNKKSKF